MYDQKNCCLLLVWQQMCFSTGEAKGFVHSWKLEVRWYIPHDGGVASVYVFNCYGNFLSSVVTSIRIIHCFPNILFLNIKQQLYE